MFVTTPYMLLHYFVKLEMPLYHFPLQLLQKGTSKLLLTQQQLPVMYMYEFFIFQQDDMSVH